MIAHLLCILWEAARTILAGCTLLAFELALLTWASQRFPGKACEREGD